MTVIARIVPVEGAKDALHYSCPYCNQVVALRPERDTTSITCPCGQVFLLGEHVLIAELT